VAGIAAVVLAALGLAAVRPSRFRHQIAAALSEQLDSNVEIADLDGSIFPSLKLTGTGLVVRHRGRAGVPPLMTLQRFSVEGSLLGLLRRPIHIRDVRGEGLTIQIPPRGDRGDDTRRELKSPFVIDHLEATGAQLIMIPRRADRRPRIFQIHTVSLESFAFDRQAPFRALLTNPVPEGEIDATGTLGPWRAVEPGSTPVAGRFTLTRADLGTIRGLGGTLDGTGTFEGRLDRIEVLADTSTPDFRLDVGSAPVPLLARAHVVVDGTDGDTTLETVEARFRDTTVLARGAVLRSQDDTGRSVALDVDIDRGRIEDLLELVISSPEPLMTGEVSMQATMELPREPRPVVERLKLRGEFGVAGARFTGGLQAKVSELSRRGRGRNAGEAAGEVVSNLRGHLVLDEGIASFSDLTFEVPGASIRLAGRYALRSETLDFRGTLRLTATVSQAAGGGVKSALLKVFDPFFRKPGAGTQLPIRILGTRSEPKFGLDLF
jgi:hypothetical protein